jgi:hypothetical protein
MQFGLATEIGNENADIQNAVRGAKIEILRWVYRAAGLGRPNFADISHEFENNDRPGVKFGVATNDKIWVAKVEHSDREIRDRYWTTEVCVVEDTDFALLGVRNVCTSGADVVDEVPVSTPNFVKFFAKRIGLLDADTEISADVWRIQDEQDLDDLYDLVVSPERFLPVILVTEPYRINIDDFARNAVGVAHVVALPDSLSLAWTERITKEMSAYLGAIRTYNPDVDLRSGSPFDHPMTLGGRVAGFVAPDGSVGEEAYANWLLRKAYRIGANRILRDKRFPRFTEVRAARLIAQRRDAGENADRPLLIEIAEQEVEQYKQRALEAQQLQDEALSENKTLAEDVSELRAQSLGMQIRIETLIAALRESGRQEVIDIPGDLRGLKMWADQHLSGRVFLLPRALNAAKDSIYEKPEDIYDALLWLAQYYWPSKTAENPNDEARERSRARLTELGLEYAGSIDQRHAGDEYYASYGGERRFMNMALKKGNSREPRYCMRIYTFWDEDAQATIVGHLPSHLDNTLS